MSSPNSPKNRRLLLGRARSRSSPDSQSQSQSHSHSNSNSRPSRPFPVLSSLPNSPYTSSHESHNSLPMSLEAALDEERLKILSILQGNYNSTSNKLSRSGSSSSSPPVRSMLDVSLSPQKPATRPSSASQSDLLEKGLPTRTARTMSNSSSSDAQPSLPIRSVPAAQEHSDRSSHGHQKNLSSSSSSQLGTHQGAGPGSEATRVAEDSPGAKDHTDQGQPGMPQSENAAGSESGPAPDKDDPFVEFAKMRENRKKPKKRQRQQEQRRRLLASLPSHSSGSDQFIIDPSSLVESEEAYRKLSDHGNAGSDALAGLYAMLSRDGTIGGQVSDTGLIRLQKDDLDEEAITTSEDDDDDSSSDEDKWRGRKVDTRRSSDESNAKSDPDSGPQTLLGSVEEERLKLVQSSNAAQKYKSLLDPPEEKQKKGRVHPLTSFDEAGINTPFGSDDEAVYSDIRTAQNLSIYLSPPDNRVDKRIVQTMVRGEWETVITELKAENRRQRTYLVATDLSEEAEYALEWTFGTIVRDGDTIHVVYAMEEGAVTKAPTGPVSNATPNMAGTAAAPPASNEAPAGDEQRVQDIAAVVGKQTEKSMATSKRFSAVRSRPSSHSRTSSRPSISRLSSANRVNLVGGNGDGRAYSSAGPRPAWGDEGKRALDRIVQKCMHLLRKTRLQVRVAVVVIGCKNARHLITEAIDGMSPTMVILGSRGRSALKNVLLGSFSNYLVNKSSVPVMVARKKLRKHSVKYRSRQTNNLRTPRSLAAAKID